MKRILIGHITVDTGQFIIIIDPCYLSQWQDNEFQDIRRYKRYDSAETLQYLVDFGHYDDPIKKEGGRTMNELLHGKVYTPVKNGPPARPGFDYNSACQTTIEGRKGGELQRMGTSAIVSRTAWGDGKFPVCRVEDDEGELLRVEISFEEEA